MAVKTSCGICKKTFSAPDEYRGRKVDCPSCGKRTVVESAEDRREAQRREEEDEQRKAAAYDKLALLERLEERRGRGRAPGRPYYEAFGTGTGSVQHYKPGAPSRFVSLRALSDLLLVGAYLEACLAAVGLAGTVFLWVREMLAGPWALLASMGWLGLGAALFLVLKFLAELALLFADTADQQGDIVKLLIDLRSNTDSSGDPI